MTNGSTFKSSFYKFSQKLLLMQKKRIFWHHAALQKQLDDAQRGLQAEDNEEQQGQDPIPTSCGVITNNAGSNNDDDSPMISQFATIKIIKIIVKLSNIWQQNNAFIIQQFDLLMLMQLVEV